MRVLHIIPSLDAKEGGPSVAVKVMAEALAAEGVEVTILTTQGAQNRGVISDQLSVIGKTRRDRAMHRGQPESIDGVQHVFLRRSTEFYKTSWELVRWLRENITKFDLVHVHALFSFSSTVAARIARRKNVPYIVRPLGVLNRWGMRNRRRMPKVISFRLVELPILLNAAAIHFTSEAERKEAVELDRRLAEQRSVVIPLPIEQRAWSKEQRAQDRGQPGVISYQLTVNRADTAEDGGQRSEIRDQRAEARGQRTEARGQRTEGREQRAEERGERADAERFFEKFPGMRGKRIVLFLSRIDRKKGLELLLDAFAMVRQQNRDVVLVVAGEGEKAYVRELQERMKAGLQITGRRDDGTTGQRDNETAGNEANVQRPTSNAQRPIEAAEAEGSGPAVSGQWAKGRRQRSEVRGQSSGSPSSISHLQSPDPVIWTGHLTGEMKAAALAAADVFVLPSASENFGIAAAESLAAGVPTLVSQEVALSDDIQRYNAGLVVKRDATEVAGAIGDLLSNRERAATLARNGRRLAEERYSPTAVGKALHQLYRQVIS
jgi:glycosyltransferase involved in cell wall biosynthesis